MTKEYVVTATYTDKKSGEPVSSIAPIMEGTSKTSGQYYEIANLDSREVIDGSYRVGTRLAGMLNLAVKNVESAPQEPKQSGIKLGKV